jgi:PAS domain S-box-containing protein
MNVWFWQDHPTEVLMGSVGHAPKVLIVEDEAIIGLDMKRLLADAGFDVAAVAATAKQAMRLVQTSSPDLVLMDIHIKGPVDGIDTAHHIRQKFRLPVVFVTAHADKNTLERARQSGPFGFITKPISALGLVSTIEMALHKHSVQRQLEKHCAWLRIVLEDIPDAVLVTDLGGRVQFINSSAERLIGLTGAEVVGKLIDSVLTLLSGDQSNLASQLLDTAEWGNRTSFPGQTVLRPNGSNANVRVEGEVAISYADGEPAGGIFTVRDVSRREQEESVLRQEERMLALGRLSAGIAGDFGGCMPYSTPSATNWRVSPAGFPSRSAPLFWTRPTPFTGSARWGRYWRGSSGSSIRRLPSAPRISASPVLSPGWSLCSTNLAAPPCRSIFI